MEENLEIKYEGTTYTLISDRELEQYGYEAYAITDTDDDLYIVQWDVSNIDKPVGVYLLDKPC